MRNGVRLGIDVGTVRIGVARSDPEGLLAVPVETVDRQGKYLLQLQAIIDEYEPFEILVGLPLALSGRSTSSTQDAVNVARELSEVTTVPIRLIDERLTTVSAHGAMRASGKNQKQSRAVIDQVAAVMILQQGLESEKASGNPPGSLLSEFPAHS